MFGPELRSVLVVLVLAKAALLPLSGKAQVDWRALTLEGDKKAIVYFPGSPVMRADTVETALGPMPFQTWFYQDDEAISGNRLYTLTMIDYPEGSFPVDSVERRMAFFESTVSSAAESVEGDVMISQPLEGQRYPGWYFRVDYGAKKGKTVYNHVVLAEDRYYHLQVFALSKDEGSRTRGQFFDNFTPRPQPRSGQQ